MSKKVFIGTAILFFVAILTVLLLIRGVTKDTIDTRSDRSEVTSLESVQNIEWLWLKTVYPQGGSEFPLKEGVYSLLFKKDGTFHIITDCGITKGVYKGESDELVLKMNDESYEGCSDSQGVKYIEMVKNIDSYSILGQGELNLWMKDGKGFMTFFPRK